MAHNLPTIGLIDHRFQLPLDHAHPKGAQIEVRAREVAPVGSQDHGDKPMLVFLQGGPGFGAPRPNDNSGWIGKALETYRVLLLDERGTGRSSPLSFQTLGRLNSPGDQAAYLKHFRSDSIVLDCEWVRRELLGESTPWTVLGQSYGGFCATHYLSAAPHGLREVLITGGLPQLAGPTDDVYRLTYPRFTSNGPLIGMLEADFLDFLGNLSGLVTDVQKDLLEPSSRLNVLLYGASFES